MKEALDRHITGNYGEDNVEEDEDDIISEGPSNPIGQKEVSLEFRKKSKLKGVVEGYYFKGKLLSRYKTEAIDILRKRVEQAGKGDFMKGKELLPDEYSVINQEWLKGEERTKKIHIKKKPYYDRLHINSLKHQLLHLQNKIENLISKRSKSEQEYNDRINAIESEKEKMMGVIEGK
jgi:hypothetical protein